MAAYVIVDVDVTDPVEYEVYKKMSPAAVAAYGGRYLARGGAITCLEGDWAPQRVVVLEFESVAQAKAWFSSPEYAPAKQVGRRAFHRNMVVVEGL